VTGISAPASLIQNFTIHPLPQPGTYQARATLRTPQKAWLGIFDLQGREVQRLEIQNGTELIFEWSMLAWPRGVYLLRLENKNGVLGSRLWVR
ncbi:MAG: T9SS type A sorting domain-containing protein, partial [Bacteroidota bacterium]